MSDEDITRRSQLVCERLSAFPLYSRAATIGFYHPIRGEVSLWSLFEKAIEDKRSTLFPRIVGQSLEFVLVRSPKAFQKSRSGIPIPMGDEIYSTEKIDCILVPGVGFDRSGYRLGFGGAFYDRALKDYKGLTIGVAFDFQIVQLIPHDPWDIPCQWVFSESEIIEA